MSGITTCLQTQDSHSLLIDAVVPARRVNSRKFMLPAGDEPDARMVFTSDEA